VGARATVHLPGGGPPEQVGHGRHHWVIDDTPASAPVDTIRDLMDDVRLWPQVVDAAIASGVVTGDEPAVARQLAHYLDWPVSGLLSALAPPEMLILPGDLAQRLEPVLSDARTLAHPSPSRDN